MVDEGSFAQITCSVTKGDEPLTITWHLHGDDISSEPSITTTMIGSRTSILIISEVGYRHSGLYSCRATNPAGSSTHSAELKVNGNYLFLRENGAGRENKLVRHYSTIFLANSNLIYFFLAEPPRIVPFSFGSDVVDEGAFAQLTCSVSHGDEPMTLTWSLKGDIISSEPSITTTMVGRRTSFLIISEVGYRHSGEYTCRAENKAGVDSFSAQLKVNGN